VTCRATQSGCPVTLGVAGAVAVPISRYALLGGAVVVLAALILLVIVLRRRRSRSEPKAAAASPGPAGDVAGSSAYLTGFDDGPAGSSWSAGLGAPGTAAAEPATEVPAREYLPATAAPSGQAPWDQVSSAGDATSLAPYAAARPSERAAAGQSSYGGTQSFPGPSVVAFPGPVAPTPFEPANPTDAGWYPIDSDPNRQRYWDGTKWTERLRWDGTAWVDE
jgi:hypothetical protein